MIPRRAPGQRRRRTRREDELAQVEAMDPERARELEELRRYNPQAFRKELQRLVRDGKIRRGRGFEVPDALLGLLGPHEPRAVIDGLERAERDGELGHRTLAGLLEAEGAGAAREEVLEWLDGRYEQQLDRDNRSGAGVPRVTQR